MRKASQLQLPLVERDQQYMLRMEHNVGIVTNAAPLVQDEYLVLEIGGTLPFTPKKYYFLLMLGDTRPYMLSDDPLCTQKEYHPYPSCWVRRFFSECQLCLEIKSSHHDCHGYGYRAHIPNVKFHILI